MTWRIIDARGRILSEESGRHARTIAVMGRNFFNDPSNRKEFRIRFKRPVRIERIGGKRL